VKVYYYYIVKAGVGEEGVLMGVSLHLLED
jgi:hypothetical protein